MKAICRILDNRVSGLPFLLSPFFLTVISIVYKVPFYDSVGGFQYKDAGAWASCTKAMAFNGEFLSGSGEWCLRRPLFPEIASFVYRINNSLSFVALVLSVLFGIALYLLFNQARQILSLVGSVTICSATLIYWFIFCCNQILTESLAITFCVLGLVLFLKAKHNDGIKYAYLSIAFIGISQQIRPGNLFLPLLPLILLFGKKLMSQLSFLVFSLLIFLLPFLITSMIRLVFQKSEYSNAGNAWASLYGLANGNSSWQSAYSIPGIPVGATDAQISDVIKTATLDAIQTDIFAVPISIGKNLIEMLTTYFPLISPISIISPPLSIIINFILLTLITGRIFLRIKSRWISKSDLLVIVFITSTSLVSYAIAWKSEPARALMPTICFIILALVLAIQNQSRTSEKREPDFSKLAKPVYLPNSKEAIPAIGFLMALYSIAISSHLLVPLSASGASISCGGDAFSLISKSLTVTEMTAVKSFPVYSWSDDLPRIKSGQLIQGLGLLNGRIISVNAFSDSILKRQELVSNCFNFKLDGSHLGGFSDSGVKTIVKSGN